MGEIKVDKSIQRVDSVIYIYIRWLSKMQMYSLHNVVFLTLLCVASVQSDKACSVLEHREMQAPVGTQQSTSTQRMGTHVTW